jgi:hypothetical protein
MKTWKNRVSILQNQPETTFYVEIMGPHPRDFLAGDTTGAERGTGWCWWLQADGEWKWCGYFVNTGDESRYLYNSREEARQALDRAGPPPFIAALTKAANARPSRDPAYERARKSVYTRERREIIRQNSRYFDLAGRSLGGSQHASVYHAPADGSCGGYWWLCKGEWKNCAHLNPGEVSKFETLKQLAFAVYHSGPTPREQERLAALQAHNEQAAERSLSTVV